MNDANTQWEKERVRAAVSRFPNSFGKVDALLRDPNFMPAPLLAQGPASLGAEVAVLRDLIDRRPGMNACALRPGQAVHVHALERILADLQPGGPEYTERMCYHHDRDALLADFAALETFEEMCAYEGEEEVPIKPGELDTLIQRARELLGYTLLPPTE